MGSSTGTGQPIGQMKPTGDGGTLSSALVGPQPYQVPKNANANQPIGPIPVMPQPTNPTGPRNANQPIGPIPVMPQPEKNPYIPPIINGPMPNENPNSRQPKMDPGTGPNIYTQASGWLDQAASATRNAMHYDPRKLSETNLNPYMNPYTQSVIDTSMADMERGRKMAINSNGAAATAAGAFGGSRHGLVEAETNRGFADEVGQLSSGLNKENFYQAQQGAQSDINNDINQNALRMQGAGQLQGLSGQAFGYGQTLTDNQLRQGEQQRAIQQQIIDAGKDQWAQSQNTPDQSLQRILAMLGGAEYPTSQTNTKNPGWGDFAKYFLAG